MAAGAGRSGHLPKDPCRDDSRLPILPIDRWWNQNQFGKQFDRINTATSHNREMELEIHVQFLLLITLCSAYPQYYHSPSLSYPERVPELGLTPRYHDLVYQYIAKMAGGQQQPIHVAVAPTRIEEFGISGGPALPDGGMREPITEVPSAAGPLQPSHLLPSDFILLATSPQSQFFGHFDLVKNSKMKYGTDASANPPIGGVLSNYIIRNGPIGKAKRQTFPHATHAETDEDVVITASETRINEHEKKKNKNENTTATSDNSQEEPQPAVAQSKPSAIALAGPGGVAQAAPVATAVVGKDGLAVAAPVATAVAGKGAQGALQVGGEEKLQRSEPSSASTKSNKTKQ